MRKRPAALRPKSGFTLPDEDGLPDAAEAARALIPLHATPEAREHLNRAARAYDRGDGRAGDTHMSAAYAAEPVAGIPGETADAGLASITTAIELAQAREYARVMEDAGPRGKTTEQRLAAAYDRIGRGTYTPQGGGFELASPAASAAGRALAAQRWTPAGDDAALTGMPNCGPSDEYGHCMDRHHSPDCGSLADPALVTPDLRAVMHEMAWSPLRDADGRAWENQFGTPFNLNQLIEAKTGVRTVPTGDLFEDGQGSRQLFQPALRGRYGDLDGGEDDGIALPDVSPLAAALGLATPSAASRRESARAQVARARAAVSSPVRDGDGESMADRRERMRTDFAAVQLSNTWNGSLPTFTRGQRMTRLRWP